MCSRGSKERGPCPDCTTDVSIHMVWSPLVPLTKHDSYAAGQSPWLCKHLLASSLQGAQQGTSSRRTTTCTPPMLNPMCILATHTANIEVDLPAYNRPGLLAE
jgi:hypothetical protein